MRTERFFVPEEWIAPHARAFTVPAGSVHRQIVSVLRMKAGDALTLCINDGKNIDAKITTITRSAITGSIEGVSSVPLAPPPVIVCAAMTKRDTFEWMLQKCTELGTTTFIPMTTDRVVKRTPAVPKRWVDIVREASEQSGRTVLPAIEEPRSLASAIAKTEGSVRIAFHESGDGKMPRVHKTNAFALFIGPEGGFTDAEIAQLKTAGAHVVTLGDLVLRAETAAVVATTMVRLT